MSLLSPIALMALLPLITMLPLIVIGYFEHQSRKFQEYRWKTWYKECSRARKESKNKELKELYARAIREQLGSVELKDDKVSVEEAA